MDKNIKDYLHLYYNAKAKWHGHTYDASMFCEGNIYSTLQKEVKLILRPLSDMSTEETIHYEKMVLDAQDYQMNKVEAWSDSFVREISEHVFYLLSKHFDLFGLIDAGLAIDKTKTKTHD